MRHRQMLCLAVLTATAAGMPAVADQKDPRLGPLLTTLHAAPTSEEARPIEAQIWDIWAQFGNQGVDLLLAEGVSRLNEGNAEAALTLFNRVVQLAPDFAEGWNKRATTLYAMGQFEKSISDIDKVLTLEPRHFGALSGLGLCNIRLGKDKEALAAFQRAAEVDPNLPGVQARIEALKQQLIKDQI